MDTNEYRLELTVEQTEYAYFTRVNSSPVGPVAAPFTLSITRRQLDELDASLRKASTADGFEQNWLREELQTWGRRLFEALFSGDVLDCYRASKKMADDAGRELRIHLDLSEISELTHLPWEYLYDAPRQEYVGLSAGTLFSRYSGMMRRLLPPKREGALRALVVVSSPDGLPEIDVQKSWLGLLDRVDYLAQDRRLVLEWLQRPTLLDLQRRLRGGEFHILHFMGHSAMDMASGQGKLLFEDEVGRSRSVEGEHLGQMLRDHFPLRLVVLTGGIGSGRGGGVRGGGRAQLEVARSLVKRGVNASLTTPFNLPIDEFYHFLARFYHELAHLTPVDRAAALARSELREKSIWWGGPVLWTRSNDGNLFTETADKTEQLASTAEENIAFRLNALRIRTATPEAMARWSEEVAESRFRRRSERD